MKLYEVYYPELEVHAKFKTLGYEEATSFVAKNANRPKFEYVLLVVDLCVYNLRSEIMVAMRACSTQAADEALMAIYNGCIMLNPLLDINSWLEITRSYNTFHIEDASIREIEKSASPSPPMVQETTSATTTKQTRKKPFSIPAAKFLNLEKHLNSRIIGQKEAVQQVAFGLKRAQASLNDPNRPIGVYFFAGPSGVGKTLIAKELHKYLFGANDLVRIDCGEYQHKHENQKLIGSPNGFVGFEEGGQLSKAIAKNPNTVLLLDEAEKAHPDFWNTFLKVFDDGFLTDNKGNNISFKNVIIIITSNLGNDVVSRELTSRSAGFNKSIDGSYNTKTIPQRSMVERSTKEAIHKFFKPELLNRLDDVVIFNHLQEEDYMRIAELEMSNLADKLLKQNYDLTWSEEALALLAGLSGATVEGARGMAKVRRDRLENPLADLLLNRKHPKGTMFSVTVQNEDFVIT